MRLERILTDGAMSAGEGFAATLHRGKIYDHSSLQRFRIQLFQLLILTLRNVVQLNLLLEVWVSAGDVAHVGKLES